MDVDALRHAPTALRPGNTNKSGTHFIERMMETEEIHCYTRYVDDTMFDSRKQMKFTYF